MSDIPAANPTVVPARAEQVFDLWRIPEFRVDWPTPSMPMECYASFVAAKRDADGKLADGPRHALYHVPDLWTLAAQDEEVASVLNALIAVLTRKASEAGVI